MKKKLQEYAQIAEILSAVAIVISLIFVGFEIRQNTDMLRRNEMNITMDHSTATRMLTIDMADIIVKAVQNPDTLDPVENLKLSQYLSQVTWASFQIYDREQGGFVDEGEWGRASKPGLIRIFTYPFARTWWDQSKASFEESFVDSIDNDLIPH